MDNSLTENITFNPKQDSPPPTDDELQQFLDYMEAGVLNEDRLEYEERRRREQDQVLVHQ